MRRLLSIYGILDAIVLGFAAAVLLLLVIRSGMN